MGDFVQHQVVDLGAHRLLWLFPPLDVPPQVGQPIELGFLRLDALLRVDQSNFLQEGPALCLTPIWDFEPKTLLFLLG